ncbi:hypothetical protein KAX17_06880 [Candidatus Bipolaricaulota bacterium]|nr:hypothetical protein [Candidatus Bipolaricaulota bacterium]
MLEVPKIRFREPERNLPGRRPRSTTAETRFTIQFARAYLSQHVALHHGTDKRDIACARQVAVNGLGIADLVTVAWKQIGDNWQPFGADELIQKIRPTVRAFEVKLNSWRRGMTQAHRYRYFANAAILVLPAERCERAVPYLDTFRRIRVGLWGFDPSANRIVAHYTPHPCAALEPKYQTQAVELVARASRSLPVL